MDSLGPRLLRMWKVVGVLLLCVFLTKTQACHVFVLGASDDGQSRGQAVTFVRGEVEMTVKALSQGEGKLGLYLHDQNGDIAGITLEQTNTSFFIEFLSKMKKNQEEISEVNENLEQISIAFINTTLFERDVMRRVRLQYSHGLLAVAFLVKREELREDDLDFRPTNGHFEPEVNSEYWITRRARVIPIFDLPLSIYPAALAGQGFKVSLNCLKGLGDVDPSKYFLKRFPTKGSSWMYLIPSKDFKLATLIFDLSEGAASIPLSAEDFVIDRYNLLRLDYRTRNNLTEVLMPSKRSCLKRIRVDDPSDIFDVAFVANAPVKWYFDQNGPTPPADLLLPECGQQVKTLPTGCRKDADCNNLCQYRSIGLHRNTSTSAKVPLVDRADFVVKPGGRTVLEFNFSVWLQDAGHLLAGVHVLQRDRQVECHFYQVKNITYTLRDTQTLQIIQPQDDTWISVYLSYTGAELEIGMKSAEGNTWQTAKSTIAVEHQLPMSAFVWSKEDLHVAIKCETDDGSSSREPYSITSSLSREDLIIREGSTTIYFRPLEDFRVATVILGDRHIRHLRSSNVVIGEWNRISFWIPDQLESSAFLARIGFPRRGGCRLQEEIAWHHSSTTFLSNIPLKWYFGLPPGQSEGASETCAVNSEDGCVVTVIGRKVSQPVSLLDEVEFGVRMTSYYPSHGTLSIVLTTALQEVAKIDIAGLRERQDYFMYSEELGFDVHLGDFHGFAGRRGGSTSKIGLRYLSSGHVEVKLQTYSRDLDIYLWHTYKSNKTIELDASIMFYVYSNDSKVVFFYGDRGFEEVDPNETKTKSRRIIVDENGTIVTFRSPIKSITSLNFDLLDGTRTAGRFQLYHTDKDNVSALSYNEKVTVIVEVAVQPNRWTELLLRQMESEVQIGLRTSSDDEWVTKRVSIGVIPKQPLIAVFDSRHYHDLILNCKRDDGRFVAENEITSDVPEVSTGIFMPQLVWAAKTAEISSVASGQTSSIIVLADRFVELALLYLRHRDGSISSVQADLGMLAIGNFTVIYLNNTGEEEGVSSVNVPNQVGERIFRKVENKGPVESFDIYAMHDSFWFYTSCDKVPGAEMREKMSTCIVDDGLDVDEHSPAMTQIEKEVPAGNSMLLFQYYRPVNVVVYFHHNSGDVSVREVSESSFDHFISWFRIHNTENPEGHTIVLHTLAGHFESLEGEGPVKKVTLFLPAKQVCIILLGTCD